MSELRPIGFEFWQSFSMSQHGIQRRFLYRIVAHEEVAISLRPDGPTRTGETVQPIASQSRSMNGVKMVQLSDRMVEDYTFGDWGEIEWREGETPHEVAA